MKNAIAAALLVSLVAACGGSSASSGSLETQSKNAMPTSDKVKMSAPGTASSSRDGSTGQLQQNDTVGGSSDYFTDTVALSAVVNVSAAAVLGLLTAITDQPATNCDAASNTCTWGPGSSALDANVYKLVVVKQGDGSFKYTFSGQSKLTASGPFVAILTGTAIPSATAHVGSGEFIIDNDARATLPGGNGDSGKITVDYSNTSQLTISASATGVKDNNNPGQKLNVGYVYANHADGGGDLDVAFKNLTSLATLSLHSRWQVSGAGRGDAKFTTGNGAITVTQSECWAAAASGFTLGYLNGPNGISGSASACVFTDAQFGTVAPPQ